MSRISRVLFAFMAMGTLVVGLTTQAGAATSTTLQGIALMHSHTASGSWGAAVEVAGTAALNAGASDEVDDVSCASPGNCGAGGFYTDGAGHQQVWVSNEVAGSWNSAVEIPGTALLALRRSPGCEGWQ